MLAKEAATDRESIANWIGNPQQSALEWLADSMARIFNRAPLATVPALQGMSVSMARRSLTRAGLRMRVVEPSDGLVLGALIRAQTPDPGQAVRKGSVVTVYVLDPSTGQAVQA